METTSSIDERAEDIVDEFAMFPDWMSRYQYLIDLGNEIPEIDDADKTDQHKIHGCQSDVWIRTNYEDGVLRFRGDSNAKITKGLAALIIRVLDKQPPETVRSAEFSFLNDIGMDKHLSSQRQNGLAAMIKQIKERAAQYA